MLYLGAALTCILAVELFIAVPMAKHIAILVRNSDRARHVVTSPRISDHWKEKVLVRYALNIAVSSLKIGFWLLLVLAIVGAVAIALEALLKPSIGILDWLVTWPGLLGATGFSLLYFWLRSRVLQRPEA